MTGPPEIQSAVVDTLGWQGLISASVSSDDVAHGRPEPHMILRAAELVGSRDLDTLAVVGDTVNDLTAGHRAGVGFVIGVTTGAHTVEQLRTAKPTHILATVAELPP
jgi:phosphoglycolate phosphatase